MSSTHKGGIRCCHNPSMAISQKEANTNGLETSEGYVKTAMMQSISFSTDNVLKRNDVPSFSNTTAINDVTKRLLGKTLNVIKAYEHQINRINGYVIFSIDAAHKVNYNPIRR